MLKEIITFSKYTIPYLLPYIIQKSYLTKTSIEKDTGDHLYLSEIEYSKKYY